jgi:hypothetical protein
MNNDENLMAYTPAGNERHAVRAAVSQATVSSWLWCKTLQCDLFCRTDAGWNCQETNRIRAIKFEATPRYHFKINNLQNQTRYHSPGPRTISCPLRPSWPTF